MKKIILFFLPFLFACQQPENLKSKIAHVIQSQEIAWNRGDIESFMSGYWKNDSMQFITKKGIRYGWTETLNSYKKSYSSKEKMGSLHFDKLKIDCIGTSVGHVTGTWQISYPKDSIGGHFSLLFKTFEGKPKIIVDHTW
ncbi:DUF4440 domain-containing protein [Bacteroidia bacterium]|nr:DUF4440 domain-containing protein [Bacteroidia bacterium]